MIEDIFSQLPDKFMQNCAEKEVSFYFSLGENRQTVVVTPDNCSVSEGRTVDNADCVCKTSPEFFCKIWQEDYRPSMKDFLTGTIKSNNPDALRLFLKCFGKKP